MQKWNFTNNTTSLRNLYILTKAVYEQEITSRNHHTVLMEVLNENGASRNEPNHHPINYVCFYKMVEKKEERYVVTALGEELIRRYEEFQDEEKCAKFFFKVLLEIQYPNDAVDTDDTYQVYPFRIFFRALLDERLEMRITQSEFEKYFSVVKTEEDYEKLVQIIINSRNGVEPTEPILSITRVSTIVSGWCNQFHVIEKQGDSIVFKESLKQELYPLSNTLSPLLIPFISVFQKFSIVKYLFQGLSMMKIEDEYYRETGRRGFLVKEVLDYFGIHKSANGFYLDKDMQEVANFLLVQPDIRYRNVAKILRDEAYNVVITPTSNMYLEQYKAYYQKHLSEYEQLPFVMNFQNLRNVFLSEFPLEKLKELTLEEYSMGHENFRESLSYQLEYGKYKDLGPTLGGYYCYQYGIYQNSDGTYRNGRNQIIENPEEYFEKFKEELYQVLRRCEGDIKHINIMEEYPLLKGCSRVITKLAYIYYPDKFINICAKNKLEILCNSFSYSYHQENTSEQLSSILNDNLKRDFPLLYQYSSEIIGYSLLRFLEDVIINEKEISSSIVTGADSILYYGVPGCGKSHIVNERYAKTGNYIRVVFHQEYTSGEFIGQIFPTLKKKIKEDGSEESLVEYAFKPGPFTKILKQAIFDPYQPYYLIIEELNRGNAPAIFGDLFQLIDRDEVGNSKYSIDHEDLAREIYGMPKKIYLPSNLYIIATMNTSDQNVFPLDTAFKRRWTMEKISNKFTEDNKDSMEIGSLRVPNTSITWKNFIEVINQEILDEKYGSNGEDKQLGIFFVRKDCLRKDETEDAVVTKKFAFKVLMYLWEDAVKYGREYMFKNCKTLDELIEGFEQNGLGIFEDTINFEGIANESYNS